MSNIIADPNCLNSYWNPLMILLYSLVFTYNMMNSKMACATPTTVNQPQHKRN